MKRKIVFILTFMVLLLNSLTGKPSRREGEEKDLSLMEIDRLIRRTEYDEALKQLNIYIIQNPQNFDNAQIRINRIMNIRQQYSVLAEKLIDMIINDPENSKEIYEIISQLEKFERHPSDKNLQFIADLKKSTEFSYFRSILQDIEQETAQLTGSQKYIEAVAAAKEGFWLYREEYFEKWENNADILGSTAAIIQSLDNQIELYSQVQFHEKIQDSISAFLNALNQPYFQNVMAAYENLASNLKKFRDIQNEIYLDSIRIQEQFAQIQKIDDDATDASYLPFIYRLITGFDSIPKSGMTGAFEDQWYNFIRKINNAVVESVKKKYQLYVEVLQRNLVSESQTNQSEYLDSLKKYVELEQLVVALFDLNNENGQFAKVNPFKENSDSTLYALNLATAVNTLCKKYDDIRLLDNKQKSYIAKIQNSKTLSEVQIKEMFKNTNEIINMISVNNFQLQNRDEWESLNQLYRDYKSKIADISNDLIYESWNTLTARYKTEITGYSGLITRRNECAELYRLGFKTKLNFDKIRKIRNDTSVALDLPPNGDEIEDLGILYCYPELSHRIAVETMEILDENRDTLNSFINVMKYQEESQKSVQYEVRVKNLISETYDILNAQLAQIDDDRQKTENIVEKAVQQLNAFQRAKNEAEHWYASAETAFRDFDFENARKRMQLSLTKYNEALNNQDDDLLRSECDEKLQNLAVRISRSENEKVVIEVRELKNRAKDAFFNGRFEEAEKLLNQAKIRWAVTNIDEDLEISNLETYVSTAVSMNTGREIASSSPLYSEMSQLLNIAYKYFEEGKIYYDEKNTREGDKSFNFAIENLQKVQLVYPLNQEAAVLSLKINQIKNPQKFNEEFAQKVEAAKLLCQNSSSRREGYANLLDYYEINPSYKGLKQLIYQTEIDIGIRMKPVDNSAEKKTKELIAKAQKAYNAAGNNTEKLNDALALINQALEYDYNNKTASALKDTIKIKIGGNNSLVLSTEDKRYYDLALQALRSNRAANAKIYAERIANKNSKDVKDLKNKINAAL